MSARSLSLFWLSILALGSLFVRVYQSDTIEYMDVLHVNESPSVQFIMGTDSLGRNYFLRLLKGCGISLFISLQASLLSLVIAIIYGGVAGWFSKQLDFILTVVLDVWMSIPTTIMATLVALTFLDNEDSFLMVGVMIGITHWGRMARIIKSEIIRIKNQEFISASKLLGGTNRHILTSHIFPHIYMVIATTALYQLPNLILSESFMSYIGLGIHSPETSLGVLLQDGWRNLRVYPHLVFFPALVLFLTILALSQISESFDKALEPREKEIF